MTLAGRLRAALDAGAARGPAPFPGDFDNLVEPGMPHVPAAVLMPITDRPAPGVLLTLRNANLRRHAGQVAFPGGRLDPADAGPVAAALREAEEEIGLPPALVEVAGIADRYRTGTGYDITPVVGVVPPDLPLLPQESEVAAIFEVPLDYLLDPAMRVERTAIWQGRERRYFEIMWKERRIWGVTAAMIANLAHRLLPVA
ncbi:CoA pyrophosphatase [Sphingomonas oleivorans]|uniref:CoA pyrophosphatase n=1 Tax=Sphingomonas oleivorans TaxID=1735121 RepID=A0A2T5G1J8_9SPHN|nr:CoA pyrophosphatase [Sphingomonas oleivorans]PTQ13012.1 CoA pyrophosphatase [Sphingomonas oleivorans]